MHCAENFPARKQTSDLDVPLPVGMEDDDYLRCLAEYLPDLLTQVKPDLVLYDAGADTHQEDRLGKLAMTDTGLYRRDRMVLRNLYQSRTPRSLRNRRRLRGVDAGFNFQAFSTTPGRNRDFSQRLIPFPNSAAVSCAPPRRG